MAGRGKIAPRELLDQQQLSEAMSEESVAESDEEAQSPSRSVGNKAPRHSASGKSCKRPRADSPHEEDDEEDDEDDAPSADGGEEDEEGEEEADSEDGDREEEDATVPVQPNAAQEMQKLRTDNYDKSQRIKELENDIDNWKAQHEETAKERDEAQQENQRLTIAEAALKREITRLRGKCGEGVDGTTALVPYDETGPREEGGDAAVAATHALAPMRSLTAAQSGSQDFSLALLMPKDYGTTAVPYYFKTTGHHFPHRVQQGKSGTRQYVIESRILVQFACKLVDRSLGDKVCTELALPTKDPVRFKLEVCFVTTNEVVKCEDLKTPPATLMSPPESQVAEVRMINGEIKFKFHAKFLSRNTKDPTGQEFFFKISCLNPELERFALNTASVPFLVVSREVKPKASPTAS